MSDLTMPTSVAPGELKGCVVRADLFRLFDGRLAQRRRKLVERHLSECDLCAERTANLVVDIALADSREQAIVGFHVALRRVRRHSYVLSRGIVKS